MNDNATIQAAIQAIAGVKGEDKVHLIAATVESVDEAARTCNVVVVSGIGQTIIENVQLMASIDDGILLVPAIDSTIIVSYSAFNQPFVSLFSGLSKILLVAGEENASIQIDEDGIKFNEGDLGGLVKVIDLTAKLNALENKVNAIIAAYNSHTHVLALSAGTGTAAPTTTGVAGTLTPTQRADIENDLITM